MAAATTDTRPDRRRTFRKNKGVARAAASSPYCEYCTPREASRPCSTSTPTCTQALFRHASSNADTCASQPLARAAQQTQRSSAHKLLRLCEHTSKTLHVTHQVGNAKCQSAPLLSTLSLAQLPRPLQRSHLQLFSAPLGLASHALQHKRALSVERRPAGIQAGMTGDRAADLCGGRHGCSGLLRSTVMGCGTDSAVLTARHAGEGKQHSRWPAASSLGLVPKRTNAGTIALLCKSEPKKR